jgi:hypothetical protein
MAKLPILKNAEVGSMKKKRKREENACISKNNEPGACISIL